MARKIKDMNSTQALTNDVTLLSSPDNELSSEEMLQKLEAMQPELLGHKPQKPLTKKQLREQEDLEFRQSFQLEKWQGDLIHQVALSQLVQLDATPIKNARYAMRELNKEHLSHLKQAYENGAVFPPINVQYSTMGFIVGDGYHRWQVYIEAVIDAMGGEVSEQELQQVLDTAPVEVQELNILDEKELIKYSFSANLAHGLAATSESRSRYAMWLMEDAQEQGGKLSIRQAAKIAQVSHVAVIKAIGREKKRAEKQGKMVDAFAALPDEDKEEIEKTIKQDDAVESHSKLQSAITAFYKSMVTVHKELEAEFKDPANFREHMVRFFKDNQNVDKAVISDFVDILTELSR